MTTNPMDALLTKGQQEFVQHVNNDIQIIGQTPGAKKFVSDGYHTFGELYEHRHMLFAALITSVVAWGECAEFYRNPIKIKAWRSKLHEDGTMFDGMFIAGVRLDDEDIAYHIPLEFWDHYGWATTFPRAPKYDGYTPEDVLARLRKFCAPF